MILTANKKAAWKEILGIAWPLIVANSFWNLQLTIDRIFLGGYSTASLGAAMTVMGIFWTPMALLQQTAAYLATFVAQYNGAKEFKMIGPAVWQAIYVSLFGGILFLFLLLISEPLFFNIGHSEIISNLEIAYFDSLCYSALPTALVAALSAFFIGLGRTKVVMGINAVGLVANVFFDYLLIFGNLGAPSLGIAGAGYATAIANYFAAIFGCILVFNSSNNRQYNLWNSLRPNFELLNRYLRFGLPSGFQWALEGLAFTVFLTVMGVFKNGEVALASSSIAVTIMMLSILPTLGMAQAVMMLVGTSLGEKNPEQAERHVWNGVQISLIYMVIMSLTFFLIPSFYIDWFKNESDFVLWNQVSATVPFILMFIAVFTLFDSVNLVVSFALKGAGDTKFVFLVSLFLPWPLMVLPTFLLREFEGAVYFAWGAASVYGIGLALVYFVRFRGGKWKEMSVISPDI